MNSKSLRTKIEDLSNGIHKDKQELASTEGKLKVYRRANTLFRHAMYANDYFKPNPKKDSPNIDHVPTEELGPWLALAQMSLRLEGRDIEQRAEKGVPKPHIDIPWGFANEGD